MKIVSIMLFFKKYIMPYENDILHIVIIDKIRKLFEVTCLWVWANKVLKSKASFSTLTGVGPDTTQEQQIQTVRCTVWETSIAMKSKQNMHAAESREISISFMQAEPRGAL